MAKPETVEVAGWIWATIGGVIIVLLSLIAYFLRVMHTDFREMGKSIIAQSLTINSQGEKVSGALDDIRDIKSTLSDHNTRIIKLESK